MAVQEHGSDYLDRAEIVNACLTRAFTGYSSSSGISDIKP